MLKLSPQVRGDIYIVNSFRVIYTEIKDHPNEEAVWCCLCPGVIPRKEKKGVEFTGLLLGTGNEEEDGRSSQTPGIYATLALLAKGHIY